MRRSSSRRRQGGWLAHRALLFTKRQLPPITFNADQLAAPNLFTLSGNPTGPCDLLVTIAITGGGNGAILQAGLIVGAFAAGTTIKIVNNGTIVGRGGNGGDGGTATTGVLSNGAAGVAGGDAIVNTAGVTVVIDNTNGYIFGGGGGAGGGAAAADFNPPTAGSGVSSGGGGGGAQGYNNPAGGLGGSGPVAGSPGNVGNSLTPGYGGGTSAGFGNSGGQGGMGGTFGQAGSSGAGASGPHTSAPGLGGAAGYAVRLNGGAVNFLGGNNSVQVKGLVA